MAKRRYSSRPVNQPPLVAAHSTAPSRIVQGPALAPQLRGLPAVPALHVTRTTRWRGSGPAHWQSSPVRRTQHWPNWQAAQQPLDLESVRKRGMYGY